MNVPARRLIGSTSVLVSVLMAAPALAQVAVGPGNWPIPTPITPSGVKVGVSTLATLPLSPDPAQGNSLQPARINYLTHANDGSGRLFTNDMRGSIYVIDNGVVQPTPFLDIKAARGSAWLSSNPSSSAINLEQGLSTFAFHPGFSDPLSPGYRKVYTVSSETIASGTPDFSGAYNNPGAPVGVDAAFNTPVHHDVIAEWSVDAGNPNLIDTSTRREILRLAQPLPDHNTNLLAFNPTAQVGDDDYGKMYISLGDGGNTFNNPRSIPGYTGEVAKYGAAQNTLNPYGSILRIDPLGNNSANGQYGIPTTNPFVGGADPGNATLDEIWAYGFRNPQRFSWDSDTGVMLIADIGQRLSEEINIGIAGANYGWGEREGTFGVDHSNQLSYFPLSPAELADPSINGYTYPAAVYDRDEGIAVTGGFVYRGSNIPYLYGKYIFGDLNFGNIYYADINALIAAGTDNALTMAAIHELTLQDNGVDSYLRDIIAPGAGVAGRADLRLGLGEDGEIYILTKYDGTIRTLTAVPEPASLSVVVLGAVSLLRRRNRRS